MSLHCFGRMMALRGAYEHNDSDDSEKEEERGLVVVVWRRRW